MYEACDNWMGETKQIYKPGTPVCAVFFRTHEMWTTIGISNSGDGSIQASFSMLVLAIQHCHTWAYQLYRWTWLVDICYWEHLGTWVRIWSWFLGLFLFECTACLNICQHSSSPLSTAIIYFAYIYMSQSWVHGYRWPAGMGDLSVFTQYVSISSTWNIVFFSQPLDWGFGSQGIHNMYIM